MLTLFSIPKPFAGDAAVIQRNAIRSWTALGGGTQVVLVGDEPGVAAAAAELGAEHIPEVARNEHGTPRLDDAFARVDAVAEHDLRCFVNADIVLLDDFLPAVARVRERGLPFLIVGRTLDLEVASDLDLADPAVREAMVRRARAEGTSRGATAIDYLVFPAGLFDPLPPFVVGRPRFDNWLIWRARQVGPVVDATRAVVAVHQRHDYGHLAGGYAEAHVGEEGRRNYELAGGTGRRMFTIHDANRRLRPDGSVGLNPGSLLRARETLRKIAWKVSSR